jgi:hypothetical protein
VANKSADLISYFAQGPGYFGAAHNADLLVRPLLLYYGVVALTRGFLLLTDPNENTVLRESHGLSAVGWDQPPQRATTAWSSPGPGPRGPSSPGPYRQDHPLRGASPFGASRWCTKSFAASVKRRHRFCSTKGVPEVGLGLALERFTLLAQGDVYCVVDIVEKTTASMVLTALPEFPLELGADKARQFVAAWQQRAELEAQAYEVRQEQREV